MGVSTRGGSQALVPIGLRHLLEPYVEGVPRAVDDLPDGDVVNRSDIGSVVGRWRPFYLLVFLLYIRLYFSQIRDS